MPSQPQSPSIARCLLVASLFTLSFLATVSISHGYASLLSQKHNSSPDGDPPGISHEKRLLGMGDNVDGVPNLLGNIVPENITEQALGTVAHISADVATGPMGDPDATQTGVSSTSLVMPAFFTTLGGLTDATSTSPPLIHQGAGSLTSPASTGASGPSWAGNGASLTSSSQQSPVFGSRSPPSGAQSSLEQPSVVPTSRISLAPMSPLLSYGTSVLGLTGGVLPMTTSSLLYTSPSTPGVTGGILPTRVSHLQPTSTSTLPVTGGQSPTIAIPSPSMAGSKLLGAGGISQISAIRGKSSDNCLAYKLLRR
jgi:hypothetical protein